MTLMENILGTLARLQKWNGHLYNWYDTVTLAPLHPAYVSTVDSGNLAVCLTIAREGLIEYGRPDLAEKCAALLAPMSFTPLYDRTHRLFSIGFDLEKKRVDRLLLRSHGERGPHRGLLRRRARRRSPPPLARALPRDGLLRLLPRHGVLDRQHV